MSERRALIAEDSFLIASALETLLQEHNIDIVGPASTVDEAMVLAQNEKFTLAILDVNLHDQMIYPVLDLLIARKIPVILATGYVPEDTLPQRFLNIPTIQKPYKVGVLMQLVELAFAKQ